MPRGGEGAKATVERLKSPLLLDLYLEKKA